MKKFLLAIMALSMTACFHKPDNDILQAARLHYDTMREYYDDIIYCYENDKSFLLKSSDKEFVTYAKILGQDYRPTTFWSMFTEQYTEACPLHKALAKISEDIKIAENHIYHLEKRGLVTKAIYEKLLSMKRTLFELKRIIRSKDEYLEEAKFIEKTNIAKSQLYEQQKQTMLLQEANAHPKVINQVEENNYNIKFVN